MGSASVNRPAIATSPPDLLVVGAGVFGLWVAKRAVEAGLRVQLIDRGPVGGGASATPLGALMAHTPDRWNAKKQFQLDALLALPAEIAALEAETGRDCGYARVGRLMPIRSEAFAAQAAARSAAAVERWGALDPALVYEARPHGAGSEAPDPGWLAPAAAPIGHIWDSLAARLDPRAYVATLAAWLRPRARILEGVAYAGWDGAARLSDGSRVSAGAVALSAGHEGFRLLEQALGRGPEDPPLGSGVLGQAALLRLARPAPPRAPLIYDDGVYVAAHGDRTVAVGATSVTDWRENRPDPSEDGFLRRAQALCPALAGAEAVEWWSGVRPKARRRDPAVGRLPPERTDGAPIWAATGGFKISFGVAHRIGSALVDRLTDRDAPTPLPETFEITHHLA